MEMQLGMVQVPAWQQLLEAKIIGFEFEHTKDVPVEDVTAELAERVYDCGPMFYGQFEVGVGDHVKGFVSDFGWKTYSIGQRGIGFVMPSIQHGGAFFQPRCYALRPLESQMKLEELYGALTGNYFVPKKEPVLKVPANDSETANSGVNPGLLVAAKKLRELNRRIDTANAIADAGEQRVMALQRRVSVLREQVARQGDTTAIVDQKVAELLGIPVSEL